MRAIVSGLLVRWLPDGSCASGAPSPFGALMSALSKASRICPDASVCIACPGAVCLFACYDVLCRASFLAVRNLIEYVDFGVRFLVDWQELTELRGRPRGVEGLKVLWWSTS